MFDVFLPVALSQPLAMLEPLGLFQSLSLSAPLGLLADSGPSAIAGLLAQVWLWFKVALGIGLVIFVHELGHFLAAKTFGVKCEKFYVGFDIPIKIGPIKFPRTLGKFKYGETEYGIGIVPLGGYVKMLGQDDDPRKAEAEAERIRLAGGDPDAPAELDPRSYPAKPVWQRMIIISAGVVVNVVTGFMFAAIAFFFGVDYQPAVVGQTVTGGPAWEAGIESGSQIVAVAELEPDDQLHFNQMMNSIFHSGLDDANAKTSVTVDAADGQRIEYELRTIPDPNLAERRMIGVANASTAKLLPLGEKSMPTAASTALAGDFNGGVVTSVNGVAVDPDAPTASLPIMHRVYTQPAEPLELTLEIAGDDDKNPITDNVTIPPQAAKEIGIRFAIGPISTLITDGPAAKAGLKVGDQITAINDNDVDAYSLVSGQFDLSKPITLTVTRGEGESATEESIEISPSDRRQAGSPVSGTSDQVGLTAYGFAYRVSPKIASVSGATEGDKSPLASGDVIKELKVNWTGGKPPEYLSDTLAKKLGSSWEISDQETLVNFVGWIQVLPVGTKVTVKAQNSETGKVIESTLAVQETERFWHTRGLAFAPLVRVQTASSVGEAVSLGLREGKRRMGDVVRFLGLLVRGKVKTKFVPVAPWRSQRWRHTKQNKAHPSNCCS